MPNERAKSGKAGKRRTFEEVKEAPVVIAPLRYIVKSDTWESEVLVEGGRVITADEPLEDYVGDPWDALADHARGHGWAVRDKAAQAGAAPKITRLSDMTMVVDEAAEISKGTFSKLPVRAPAKPPPGMSGQMLMSNPVGDNSVTWQTPLDEIEKQMKAVAARQAERDRDMQRLVQEFAVRKAQQGSLDAMNAAIFPPLPQPFTKEQLRVIETMIRTEFDQLRKAVVLEVAREVTQYLGLSISPDASIVPKTFDKSWGGIEEFYREPSRRKQR